MQENISIEELKKFFAEENQDHYLSDITEIEKPHPLMVSDKFYGDIIENKKISGNSLFAKQVSGVKFYNCKFEDCDLTGSRFWMCTFQKCSFDNCNVDRTVLRKCEIDDSIFTRCESRYNFNISESYLYDTTFKNCILDGIEISGTDTFDIIYDHCALSDGRYQTNSTFRETLRRFKMHHQLEQDNERLLKSKEVFDDVIFKDCIISFMDFRMMNFIDTKFRNCEIVKCSFDNCVLHNYNIDKSNNTKGWGTNSIDLISLVESAILPSDTLRKIFNIDSKTQADIKEMLKEKVLSSVFISYSFKDKAIASAINEYLSLAGVTTFLWERDAPGGEVLKSIMKTSIDAKDRLLFIASENSLRSEACHFELSEGRKKQDKYWTNLLYPIHLDDFLFKVDYEQIRPRVKRDEYWGNITELRDINSLDFSAFKNGVGRNKKKFKESMDKLINSLKVK
jgi:uncharacterized protein YjbI with pentapeptide repeats